MLNFLGKSANSAGDEGTAVVRPIFANTAGAEIISSYATVPNGTVISEVGISVDLLFAVSGDRHRIARQPAFRDDAFSFQTIFLL